MKSAAFTYAFKVYRQEMDFSEGLLKSAKIGAMEDFITVLNTLAGETKYNLEQIHHLLENLQSNPPETPDNSRELISEIDQLKKKQQEYHESIKTHEHQIEVLKPTIIPGINSVLISIVGVMFISIFFVVQLIELSLICLAATVLGSVLCYYTDNKALKRQKQNIQFKKDCIRYSIEKIQDRLFYLEGKIQSKQAELNSIYPHIPPTKKEPDLELDSDSVYIPIIED